MALTAVPRGRIAAVVTDLEMRRRPALRPMPISPLRLVRWERPALDRYRALFRRVGTPWLWFSRLGIGDAALAAVVWHDAVEVYAVVDRAGIEVGMLELDFRQPRACEISYFALVPELTGKQHGRWLMAQALMLAWRGDVARVWVHTCTLDHPSALNFYRAQGFDAVDCKVETFPDPRLTGHLPRDAAPQLPLLGAS